MQEEFSIGLDISAVDPNFKEHAARGIGRYVKRLSQGLKEFFPVKDEHATVSLDFFDYHSLAPSPTLDRILKSFPVGKQTIRQQIYYPYRLRSLSSSGKGRFDLLHFPAHMDPPAFCPLPYIVSVMDLIPLVLSDLYKAVSPTWRFKLARYLELQAIRKADLILAISKSTAHDLREYLEIPEKKIIVTPLGVEEKFFTAELKISEADLRSRYNIPLDRKIILYVGGIDQRKNCNKMLETLEEVCHAERSDGNLPPVLVMAGKIEHDRQYPKLLSLITNLDLKDDVCLTGYIPDEDLLQIFAISSAFLFLSLYEGFGLPPLEAMACGVPVVSSNTSAMPEVLADAAISVDPNDTEQAAKSLLDILHSEELALSLREKGRLQAKHFSWRTTCELTAQAYKEMANLNIQG